MVFRDIRTAALPPTPSLVLGLGHAYRGVSLETRPPCVWRLIGDCVRAEWLPSIKLLKPNDIYICRTAALTSRRYILNICSTN